MVGASSSLPGKPWIPSHSDCSPWTATKATRVLISSRTSGPPPPSGGPWPCLHPNGTSLEAASWARRGFPSSAHACATRTRSRGSGLPFPTPRFLARFPGGSPGAFPGSRRASLCLSPSGEPSPAGGGAGPLPSPQLLLPSSRARRPLQGAPAPCWGCSPVPHQGAGPGAMGGADGDGPGASPSCRRGRLPWFPWGFPKPWEPIVPCPGDPLPTPFPLGGFTRQPPYAPAFPGGSSCRVPGGKARVKASPWEAKVQRSASPSGQA